MEARKCMAVAISGLTFAGAAALTGGWTAVANAQAVNCVAQQDIDPARLPFLPPEEIERLREIEEAAKRAAELNAGGAGGTGRASANGGGAASAGGGGGGGGGAG